MLRTSKALLVSVFALFAASAPARADAYEDAELRVLVRKLRDKSAGLSTRAIICNKLAKLGPKAKGALPEILEVLRDRRSESFATRFEWRQVEGTVSSGGVIGPGWVRRNVAVAWSDVGLTARLAAVEVLKAIGTAAAREAAPDVLEALEGLPDDKYQDTNQQLDALCLGLVELLGQSGAGAKDATPVLLEVVRGQIKSTKARKAPAPYSCTVPARVAAVRALGKIGTPTKKVIEALVEAKALADSPKVREAAEEVLDEWREHKQAPRQRRRPVPTRNDADEPGRDTIKEKSPVNDLVGQLSDPSVAVRRRAVEALGNLGVAARPAVPALIKALGDTDEAVRAAAVEALKKTQPTRTESPARKREQLLREKEGLQFQVKFCAEQVAKLQDDLRGVEQEEAQARAGKRVSSAEGFAATIAEYRKQIAAYQAQRRQAQEKLAKLDVEQR